MFRAQTFCFYFVIFLVLVAARPKLSSKSSKNQIEVRSKGDSTGKHFASPTWFYTKVSIKSNAEYASESFSCSITDTLQFSKESSQASIDKTSEVTTEESTSEGNSESKKEESVGELVQESDEQSYEDVKESNEEFSWEPKKESHGVTHALFVAYTAYAHRPTRKQSHEDIDYYNDN